VAQQRAPRVRALKRSAKKMTRSLYISLFVVLAAVFVPIVINFGLVVWLVPSIWGIVSAIKDLFRGRIRTALGFGVYSAVYACLFYFVARITYWVTSRARQRSLRLSLQCILLAGLFSCSFLRVVTYGSIQGRGGTYTFWTAVERYFDHHLNR
jgi:hypothetical protein